VFRSVYYLQPAGGDYGPLIDYYTSRGVLERVAAEPGCVGAELQIPVSGEGPALVTALWDSLGAYRRWIDDPWRIENAQYLKGIVEEDPTETAPAPTYQLIHGAGAPQATLAQ
jgi:heme-degrading monooxygenase HmoA